MVDCVVGVIGVMCRNVVIGRLTIPTVLRCHSRPWMMWRWLPNWRRSTWHVSSTNAERNFSSPNNRLDLRLHCLT